DRARLLRTGGHHEQRAAPGAVEGIADAADGLVLVGAVHDSVVDPGASQRLAILPDEEETLQIRRSEKAGDESEMSKLDFPEVSVQTVRHESKRGEVLAPFDVRDILAELF